MSKTKDKKNNTKVLDTKELIFEEDYNNKNISKLINWCNERCEGCYEGCYEDCHNCSAMAVKQLIVYVVHLQKENNKIRN